MIYVALTDDWELRGNGSGDVKTLQIRPMQELVSIFNRYGVRASFYAEIMQQVTFRRWQSRYPELKALADEWDAAVLDTYRQGHDIQLHLHPQWKDATYEAKRWRLPAPWSLCDHNAADVKLMIAQGKAYLENLLRSVDPNYRCVAFRAGSWAIAPSPFAMHTLAQLGVVMDTSIVGGLRYTTRNLEVDYRNVEERIWPYYPRMEDARQVSTHPEPIVCLPTHTHKGARSQYLRRDIKLHWQRFTSKNKSTSSGDWTDTSVPSWFLPLKKVVCIVFCRYLWGETSISDLSCLDYGLLSHIIKKVRRQAHKLNGRDVPVVLTCHSKDVRNFDYIDRFIHDLSRANDVRCLTLTELAQKLSDGTFPVRYKTERSPEGKTRAVVEEYVRESHQVDEGGRPKAPVTIRQG